MMLHVGRCGLWIGLLTIVGVGHTAAKEMASPQVAQDVITQHQYTDPESGDVTSYLLHEPAPETAPTRRSLLIYLYGAGGSLKSYNISRRPYDRLRAQLAARGYYILVPGLGRWHFMNDQAKHALDGVVDQVLARQQIPRDRVHIMGTSMGGGSSLAYAIHRQDLIRSVCAVMPMTDFATWIVEKPKYAKRLREAYGGTPQEMPGAYDKNSAVKNVDAFAAIPVMLIHGTADRTVLHTHSARFASALSTEEYRCEFHSVEGMRHQDAVVMSLQQDVADFFDSVYAR